MARVDWLCAHLTCGMQCSVKWTTEHWTTGKMECCYPGGGSVVLWEVSDRARARVLCCGRCQTGLPANDRALVSL